MSELSHFEKRLCRLRAQGLTVREISEIVRLSYGTTRNYFYRIRAKLQIPEHDLSLYCKANEINALRLDTKL